MAGVIDRREAIRRVSVLLGGITLVGGNTLLAACGRERPPADTPIGEFTLEDIAFLDEVAETILPETGTPGAKAVRTGAFMALMVTDTYDADSQRVFREGMRQLDDGSRNANGVSFMAATPRQRLTLLEAFDREQKAYMDAREAAERAARGLGEAGETSEDRAPETFLPGQRQEAAPGPDAGAAAAVTEDEPAHFFRMMKELALLGYFTSEIGYTQAQRYVESPGRFDPCVPYEAGAKAWAPHA